MEDSNISFETTSLQDLNQSAIILSEIQSHHQKLARLNQKEYEVNMKNRDIVLKNIQSKHAHASKKVQLLKKQRDELKSKLEMLEIDKLNATKENCAVLKEVNSKQQQVDDLKKKIEEYELKMSDIDKKKQVKEAVGHERQITISKQRIQIRDLEKKIKDLSTKYEEKENELSITRNSINKLKEDKCNESKIKFYQNKINSITEDMICKNKIIEKNQNIIAKQNAEIKSFNSKINFEERKNEEQKCENQKLKAEMERLKNSKSNLIKNESRSDFLQHKVKKLNAELDEKKHQIEKLEMKALENHKKNEDSIALNGKVQYLKKKCETLQEEIKAKNKEIQNKETSVSNKVETKLRKIEAENARNERLQVETGIKLAAANKVVKSNKLQIETLSAELQAVRKELEDKEEELIKAKQQKCESYKQIQSSTNSKLKTFSQKVQELEDEIDCKDLKIKEFEILLSSAEKDLDKKKSSNQNTIDVLRCQLLKSENEMKKVQKNLNEKEKVVNELKEEIKETENQFIEKEKTRQKYLDEALNKISHLEKDILSKNQEVERLSKKASSLTDVEAKFQSAYEELQNVVENNLHLEEENKKLTVEYSHLQMEHNEAVDKENDWAEEKDQLVNTINELESSKAIVVNKCSELEQTVQTLKETCVLLENQAEELETFNSELVAKQNKLVAERDEALSTACNLNQEVRQVEDQLTNEIQEIDEASCQQIKSLQNQLRCETMKLNDTTEKYRDLERKCKLLELNASAIQNKLKDEQEAHLLAAENAERNRKMVESLCMRLSCCQEELGSEFDRCDSLEREKIDLLNNFESQKLENEQDLFRLNRTREQQTKLIDFLQAKVEELEPNKKKKKKKDIDYQPPMQYRELQDLLEAEKSSNIQLQAKVNILRSELQIANSNVKRLKHQKVKSNAATEIGGELTPGTTSTILDMVKPTPSEPATPKQTSEKSQRTKPRMKHDIPHRMFLFLCNRATRCQVCLRVIRFTSSALKCESCSMVCHESCRRELTNNCGIPGGLFQQFKSNLKTPVTFSPVSCSYVKSKNKEHMKGELKVLCGNETWKPRNILLDINNAKIVIATSSPSTSADSNDVIDLTQSSYIHSDVRHQDIAFTAKQDVPYSFKIEVGVKNSCWPTRQVYFLASSFADKNLWVKKLEEIVSRYSSDTSSRLSNSKIHGNQILRLDKEASGMDFTCSVVVDDQRFLLGSDSGLYLFCPSRTEASDEKSLQKIKNIEKVIQMETCDFNQVVVIQGRNSQVAVIQMSQIVNDLSCDLKSVCELKNIHLFASRIIGGIHHICMAQQSLLFIFTFNRQLNEFQQLWKTSTKVPTSCLLFTPCSILFGCDRFYEVDLMQFTVDEFPNNDVTSVIDSNDYFFPISILSIKMENGKQEFLLCYNEIGVFVDSFGQRTRDGFISWSRMPLEFIFNDPYLTIIQFNAVEVVALNSASKSASDSVIDKSVLMLPGVRYLGKAITRGANLAFSKHKGQLSIYCFKGDMDESIRKAQKQLDDRKLLSIGSKRSSSDLTSIESLSKRSRSQTSLSTDWDSSSVYHEM